MRGLVLTLALALSSFAARAENIALVLETAEFRLLPDPSGTRLADQAQGVLARAGFEVVTARDAPTGDLRAELAALQARLAEGDIARLVIVASGWFVASDSGTWFIGSEADKPGLATIDGAGLRLDTIMELATAATGSAQVWLVTPTGQIAPSELGFGLRAGLPERLAVPRQVAVLRGDLRSTLAGLEQVLQPGTTLAEALARSPALRAEGSVSNLVPFLPEGFAPIAQADRDAWQRAVADDSEAAYSAYLMQFPNGLSAQEARRRVVALRNTPERIEADLALSRDERRAIQRDLTTLGFNTRGIDGLFGPGTRGAIAGWQAQADFEQTGYLTREQVFQLAGQAARRSAEIEAEERERRLALERADRAYWDSTGAGRDEPGLRAYLDRYPDGIFAALARERLAAIEAEARAQADRDAWAQAQSADTLRSYRRYLRQFPDGEFATLARRRVSALSPEPAQPASGAAEAEEARLNLPLPVRLVVERRLDQLGLDPGAVDGNLDEDSRRAISAGQERFDLPVTGYLSQPLLDAMLADVLDGVLR